MLPGLSLRRMVIATAIFIVVYSSFTIAGNATRHYQLQQETRQLQDGISADRSELTRLQAVESYLRTDAFIEQAARREGLVKPGETAIIVSAPKAESSSAAAGPSQWWERYLTP